jgi:hypothetical protein
MNYLADLLHRSSRGRALTTREAAFLQAVKGALIGFLAPLIPYFIPVLTGQEHIVWSGEALSTLLGAFIAFVLRLYFSQNDAELNVVLEAYYNAKTKQALDELIAPGADVALINFAVPIAKAAAQAAVAQPTPTKLEPEPPSIHTITTAPQPAISIPPQSGSVIAPTVPVPAMSATAADRFAAQVANVMGVNMQPTVRTEAINPLTPPQQ